MLVNRVSQWFDDTGTDRVVVSGFEFPFAAVPMSLVPPSHQERVAAIYQAAFELARQQQRSMNAWDFEFSLN